MNYFQEAKARWRGTTPKWFQITQKICGGLVVMGGTLTGISYPSKLSWMTLVGGIILGGGTFAGAVCQFVMSTASVVLEPGQTLQNQTKEEVPVTIAPDAKSTQL